MFEYVLYHSKCVHRHFSPADLDILRSAINANRQHNITGFLHREAGYYIQYFEGAKPKTEQLLTNLMADKRHYDFTVLDQGVTESRAFEDWSMGYANTAQTTLGLPDRDDLSFGYTAPEVFNFLKVASTVGKSKQ
jgi:hypothetical protein